MFSFLLTEKQCPILPLHLPPLGVTCSNERYFRSICTYSCEKGFDITPGISRVQVCDESGYWRGTIPQCIDIEPPVISKCKAVWYGYAERSETKGKIMWIEPAVHDNVDKYITPTKISGPKMNEMLTAGNYDVIFGAKDSAGNRARTCKMKLVMRVLTCPKLYNTPYLKITCPQGYMYGATCNFNCDVGSYLNGTLGSEMTTNCEKATGSHYAVWDFGSTQPFCKMVQSCEKQLNIPDNGALACDNWLNGKFCQMFCKTGYDIPPGHPSYEMFVCGNSNKWIPDITIPNCHRKIGPLGIGLRMSAHYYFDGNCRDKAVISDIEASFISNLKASAYRDGCLVYAKTCLPENVEVKCGITTKKRSVGLTIGFTFNIHFNGNTGYKQDLSLDNFLTNISALSMDLDLDINGKIYTAQDVQSISFDVVCPDLTIPSQNRMSCAICAPGSYFDSKSKTCPQCPKGMYQPKEGMRECIKCPDGTTTKTVGSKYNTSCEDACLPGSMSDNGLPPCSLCEKGTYQSNYCSIACQVCPGSKTTFTDGSSSAMDCQEFDISMKDENGSFSVAIQPLGMKMNLGFSISTWMIFESNSKSAEILKFVDSADTPLVSLSLNETLFFSYRRHHYNTSRIVDQSRWHNYLLQLNESGAVLFIDGILMSIINFRLNKTDTAKSIIVGGPGFKGSISQLNVWSSSFDLSSLLNMTSQCFPSAAGDIFSWKQAELVASANAFIDLPSECDDYNSCKSYPCHNGTCADELIGYSCSCFTGFTGKECEDNIDDCINNVCQNNATCVDDVSSYRCLCKDGFKGDLCEISVVDGQWSEWGNWSECSADCGLGITKRRRLCNSPTPDNGGSNCSGEAVETDECFLEDCPVCSKLNSTDNGILECKNDSGNLNCTYRCKSGYDFDHDPKDFYVCGPDTFHLWDFQTNDNPYGRLPYCTPIKAAKKVVIKYHAKYEDLVCDNDNWKVATRTITNQINKKIKLLSCILNGTCTLNNASATNCQGGRHKRDTYSQLSGLSVEFACNPTTHGSEFCAKTLLKVFNDIDELAQLGHLDANILSKRHKIDLNTTTISDKIICDVGVVPINYYCIPCSIGRYFESEKCKICEYGYYQDVTGQTTCKPCPVGTTTAGKGSISDTDCAVKTETSEEKSWIYGLVVGLPIAIVVVFGIAIFIWRKVYVHNNRKVADSSISLKDVSQLGPANRKFTFKIKK